MSKEALQQARVRMSTRLRSQGETQAVAVGAWEFVPEIPAKPSLVGSVKAFLTPSRGMYVAPILSPAVAINVVLPGVNYMCKS